MMRPNKCLRTREHHAIPSERPYNFEEGPGQSDKGVRTLDGQVPIAAADEGEEGSSGWGVGEVTGPVEPDDVTMRSPTSNADSNRYSFTTRLEGPQSRDVRWVKR